jgi:diguanylate cyclase (GGDEF)-like protein/PAS domain S-box-containing protein
MDEMNGLPEADYRELIETLPDAVYFTDVLRGIRFWNRAATELTGFPAEEVLGHCCAQGILRHTDGNGTELCQDGCLLSQTLANSTPRAERVVLHHRDGHRVPVQAQASPVRGADGAVIGVMQVFRAEAPADDLRERIAELEHLALLDPLTGLPNRRWLSQRFEARMDEYRRYGLPFGILMIDLDHFKAVNDNHGHDVGDLVLKAVAKSLSAGARALDTVGRWGGEEFMMVAAQVEEGRLLRIAERLRVLVSTSELREPARVGVTCSIGATVAQPGDTIDGLLRRADQALYRAKNEGRNRVVVLPETSTN